jgi:hypothetical protein
LLLLLLLSFVFVCLFCADRTAVACPADATGAPTCSCNSGFTPGVLPFSNVSQTYGSLCSGLLLSLTLHVLELVLQQHSAILTRSRAMSLRSCWFATFMHMHHGLFWSGNDIQRRVSSVGWTVLSCCVPYKRSWGPIVHLQLGLLWPAAVQHCLADIHARLLLYARL